MLGFNKINRIVVVVEKYIKNSILFFLNIARIINEINNSNKIVNK
ncbi:hypothetical protein LCGC14_2888200, partial [marine sediment metagenome]